MARRDALTFGAALNGPVTITHADGTQTVEPAATRTQLHKTINKGKRNQTRKTVRLAAVTESHQTVTTTFALPPRPPKPSPKQRIRPDNTRTARNQRNDANRTPRTFTDLKR